MINVLIAFIVSHVVNVLFVKILYVSTSSLFNISLPQAKLQHVLFQAADVAADSNPLFFRRCPMKPVSLLSLVSLFVICAVVFGSITTYHNARAAWESWFPGQDAAPRTAAQAITELTAKLQRERDLAAQRRVQLARQEAKRERLKIELEVRERTIAQQLLLLEQEERALAAITSSDEYVSLTGQRFEKSAVIADAARRCAFVEREQKIASAFRQALAAVDAKLPVAKTALEKQAESLAKIGAEIEALKIRDQVADVTADYRALEGEIDRAATANAQDIVDLLEEVRVGVADKEAHANPEAAPAYLLDLSPPTDAVKETLAKIRQLRGDSESAPNPAKIEERSATDLAP
jgi:hypothetical protein